MYTLKYGKNSTTACEFSLNSKKYLKLMLWHCIKFKISFFYV